MFYQLVLQLKNRIGRHAWNVLIIAADCVDTLLCQSNTYVLQQVECERPFSFFRSH